MAARRREDDAPAAAGATSKKEKKANHKRKHAMHFALSTMCLSRLCKPAKKNNLVRIYTVPAYRL
jgi:hypothetical protein